MMEAAKETVGVNLLKTYCPSKEKLDSAVAELIQLVTSTKELWPLEPEIHSRDRSGFWLLWPITRKATVTVSLRSLYSKYHLMPEFEMNQVITQKREHGSNVIWYGCWRGQCSSYFAWPFCCIRYHRPYYPLGNTWQWIRYYWEGTRLNHVWLEDARGLSYVTVCPPKPISLFESLKGQTE